MEHLEVLKSPARDWLHVQPPLCSQLCEASVAPHYHAISIFQRDLRLHTTLRMYIAQRINILFCSCSAYDLCGLFTEN